MSAGAENEAGVKAKDTAALCLGSLFPFGNYQQLFAYLDGLIILLPVVFPILVADLTCSGNVAVGLQRGRQSSQLSLAVLIVGKVELDDALAVHIAAEILVNVIPILTVFVHELFKIISVLYNESGNAHALKQIGERFGALAGLYANFQPFHSEYLRNKNLNSK